MLCVPTEKRLHDLELAPIFLIATDMMPPRRNTSRDTFHHPHTNFRNWTCGFPWSIGSHALRSNFVPASEPVNPLAGITILLESTIHTSARRPKPVTGSSLLV